MTLEEAKQLKDGDHILIEAIVRNLIISNNQSPFCDSGNTIGIRYKNELGYYENDYICISNIREKIEPPRRKFKEGDIVLVADGVREVCEDETDGVVKVLYYCRGIVSHKAKVLLLICPVEERHDRPAAADGSGVTRKEVERG